MQFSTAGSDEQRHVWVIYTEGDQPGQAEILATSTRESLVPQIIDNYVLAACDQMDEGDAPDDLPDDLSPQDLADRDDIPCGYWLWENDFSLSSASDDKRFSTSIGYEVVLLRKVERTWGKDEHEVQVHRVRSWHATRAAPSVCDLLEEYSPGYEAIDRYQESIPLPVPPQLQSGEYESVESNEKEKEKEKGKRPDRIGGGGFVIAKSRGY